MLEDKLKDMIVERYGSIRAFSLKADIPPTTMDSILKRGIINANVGNVIKICSMLHISVAELEHGKIVPVNIVYDDVEEITSKEFSNEVKVLLLKTGNITDAQKQHIISTLDLICGDDE